MSRHIILQDTREQMPLVFFHPEIRVKAYKLGYGDYMMKFSDGHFSNTAFERKSIADIFGTLTSGYERFKQEIQRARDDNSKLIIIVEGNLTKVFSGIRHSRVQGISIVKTLFTLWVKYGVIPVFVKNRREASVFIVQYYLAEWRNKC